MGRSSRGAMSAAAGESRIVDHAEVVLLIAEEQAVCSGRLKRKRDTFLPLLEHAIAYLHEFRVRFNVGMQILLPRRGGRTEPEAGKATTFIFYIFPAGIVTGGGSRAAIAESPKFV